MKYQGEAYASNPQTREPLSIAAAENPVSQPKRGGIKQQGGFQSGGSPA
ncbi:MAG: hypothetical protein ABW116_18455 [Candidatus Sedimenticola sp. 20ELBAFRAG]